MMPKRAAPSFGGGGGEGAGSRVRVGAGEVAGAQRLLDDDADLVLVEGLGDVVEGARLERLDRVVDGAVRGEHDHRPRGIVAERGAEQIHPVDLGHAQIGDHQVDVVLLEEGERRLAVLRGVDLVAVAARAAR